MLTPPPLPWTIPVPGGCANDLDEAATEELIAPTSLQTEPEPEAHP